jgi:hypothetical protein
MQKSIKVWETDPTGLEVSKALFVKQPHADKIYNGTKRFEIRSRRVQPQRNVLICSSALIDTRYPAKIDKKRCGITLCYVDIVDCIEVKKLSDADWKKYSGLPFDEKFSNWKHYYAWKLANIRQVYPVQVKGQVGIHRVVFDKGDLRIKPTEPIKKKRKFSWYRFIMRAALALALAYYLIKTCTNA